MSLSGKLTSICCKTAGCRPAAPVSLGAASVIAVECRGLGNGVCVWLPYWESPFCVTSLKGFLNLFPLTMM